LVQKHKGEKNCQNHPFILIIDFHLFSPSQIFVLVYRLNENNQLAITHEKIRFSIEAGS